MKLFIKILLWNILQSIHHKFDNLILNKNSNLEITPFLFIKNKNWISISFYNYIKENNLINSIKIQCLDKILWLFFSKYHVKIDNLLINIFNEGANFLKFNSKKLFYKNENYNGTKELDFVCNLKYLKINFLTKNFTENSKITNIILYDNNIEYKYQTINFLKPLVFVDLKNENINSNYFNNKFNKFYGGIINKNSSINSYYDNSYGTNWYLDNENQYIELDKKIFNYFEDLILKSFSFYINFDFILEFINNGIFTKRRKISLYKIFIENNIVFELGITLYIINNDYIFISFGIINQLNIYYKILKLNQLNNKNNLGIKFINFSFINSSTLSFYIGLKNNSVLKKDNNTLIEYYDTNKPIISFFFDRKNLSHYIGNNNLYKKISIENINIKVFINEYAFFSGNTFDEIKKYNNEYYLKIKGKDYDIVINNNKNLDRRFSLNNITGLKKCIISNCSICDFNDKCLFCYYNYYLDLNGSCILNLNSKYFVNENSERIRIEYIIESNQLKTNKNINIFENKNDIFSLDLFNNIVYFNFQIKSSNQSNLLNLKFKNTNGNLQTNLYLNRKTSSLTLFFKDFNIFKELEFSLDDDENNKIAIYFSIKQINCKNLENEIIYKNINCSRICLQNNQKYYYKPINLKYGKCVKEIGINYYLDTNINYLLKCPDNCSNCSFENINQNLICNKCIDGYNLLNNICVFSNKFNCYNKINISNIFDNKNTDNIKICNEFCNLCRIMDGDICSIINLNLGSCNIKNIKVLKYKEHISEFNFNNCKSIVDSKCLICNKNYFISKYKCLKCKNNCWKCNNKNNCLKCNKGYYLKDNKCILCNNIFQNCLDCNKNRCINKFSVNITKFNRIDNCTNYNENRICIKCGNGFMLNKNICECNSINNNFINNKNKCAGCYKCNKCIDNNELKCINCNKCKNKIIFKYIQIKNEIVIFYGKDVIINENPLFFNLPNNTNYIVIFKLYKVIIRVFEDFNSLVLKINKNIVKSSIYGYYENQKIILLDYKFNRSKYNINNKLKSLIKYKKYTKYRFKNINLSSNPIRFAVKYSVQVIHYSKFFVLFMPLIIFLNQSTLIILLNTNFDKNFVNFLKLIRKQNYYLIEDFKIFNNEDYIRSYNKTKKLYKNNIIIGDINIFDLNLIIIILLFAIYYIFMFIIKFNNKYINHWNNIKYLKLLALTLFQSNLITNYYKTIYYIKLFFKLKNGYNKIIVGFYINLIILIIIYYFNIHHFYCKLFINPYFNYKEYYNKLIYLFVNFKSKVSRNYNLLINIIDFFIVLVFMEFKNLFILQIILILSLIFLKLLYLNYIYWYYKYKIEIISEIIIVILLFNFYILIMLQNYFYGVKNLSNYILLYFILFNIIVIFKIIVVNIIIAYQKYNKTLKLNMKNLQNNNSLRYLRFSKTSFKFI